MFATCSMRSVRTSSSMKPSGQAARDETYALAGAALLGDPFLLAEWLALGISEQLAGKCFDDKRLVEIESGMATFRTASDRKALLEQLPWSQRRKIERDIASMLVSRRAEAGRIATHYLAAHDYPNARRHLIASAEKACRTLDFGRALADLQRAIDIWPANEDREDRIRVLRQGARCARNIGDITLARRIWYELLETAETDESTRLALDAHRQLADIEIAAGQDAVAREHLERAAAVPGNVEPDQAARLWLQLAEYYADRIRIRAALAAINHAEKHSANGNDMALRSEITGYKGLVLGMSGRHQEAKKFVDQALRIAVEHDFPVQTALAYRRQANISDYASDYSSQRQFHLQAIKLCRQLGEKSGEQTCMSCLAYAFLRTGEWKRAMETAREVLSDKKAPPPLKAIANGVWAMIACFRGERRTAEALVTRTLEQARLHELYSIEFYLLLSRGFLADTENRPGDAARDFREIRHLWRETEDTHDSTPGLVLSAAFFRVRGDKADIADTVDIINQIHQRNSSVETRAARHAIMAAHHAVNDDAESAIQELKQSIASYDQVGSPLECIHTRLELAGLLRASGRIIEAGPYEEAARESARALGLRPWLDRISALAAAPLRGEPDQADGLSPSHDLTPRQIDVLRMLAEGLTNKEIADRLSLSPRTVEMHVARLLDRMNCRTRNEAIAKATRRGWV